MTDDLEPNRNPYDQIDPSGADLAYKPAPPAPANPYDAYAPAEVGEEASATGAFVRGAERSALPAVGGLAAAGQGAATGAALGALVPGLGETGISEVAGGVIGGVVGGFAGSFATEKAQDYALSKAPDTWKEAIGQSDRQQKLDAEMHPTASFLGGLAPFALTMRPGGLTKGALPANATSLQRILANPATARVFGGAIMGGMELGQEATSGRVDWANVAISTGFGMVFNKPTRLGETIEGIGPRLFGRAPAAEAAPVAGAPEPAAPVAERGFAYPQPDLAGFEGLHEALHPTLAQAGDLGVMGAGFTEDTFFGYALPDESAQMVAHDAARAEKAIFGGAPQLPIDDVARRMAPETFGRYDDLWSQREAFRDQIRRLSAPEQEDVAAAQERQAALQAEYDAHLAERGGYTGGAEARRLRAQLRDAEGAYQELASRQVEQNAETIAAMRKQFMDVDFQLRDVSREVAAARRRAADVVGAETVEPAAIPTEAAAEPERRGATLLPSEAPGPEPAVIARAAEPTAAPPSPAPEPAALIQPAAEESAPVASAAAPKPIEAQRAAIEADVARKLRAAGRPADEAGATAKLISAHYEARAARFKGALGTAEDLYRAEAPAIRRSGEPSAEPLRNPNAKPRERVQSLRAFVAANGGVRDPRGDLNKRNLPNYLIKKGGVPLDKMRAMAAEAGYLGPNIDEAMANTSIGEFVEALEKPAHYSVHDEAIVAEREANARAKAEMDRHEQIADFEAEFDAHFAKAEQSMKELNLSQEDEAALRNEFFQAARGKIRLVEGRRPIITLMRDANASTFVHETGHQWLEELLRDATHEAAPDSVKADAAATRKWLGAGDGPIKTAQHEKFARGFEQYLREGVAPSARLAGVFAQFRNWLLRIYQSLKGLGAPIDEDIRGVFDRLLEEEPQRTVLTPERAAGPTLADIHEADERLTEPREADAAADRIAAERARHIEEPPPEIAHEIAPVIAEVEAERASAAGVEPAGEAGGGAVGLRDVEPGRGAPGAQPAGGGLRAGGGAERAGGGEAAPAGRGVSGQPRRDAGRPDALPLAPKPADLFGARESPFLDPAGNIRVENLTTREDVAAAIRAAAEANDDFIGDRRGVVTDGQVMDLADALGMTPQKLSARKIGQAFNAEQVMAARKLLIQSATDVSAAMKRAATGSDEDVMAYAAAKDRHQMIQGQVAGITAEAGRALRAFRNIAGQEAAQGVDQFVRQATGKTLFQLREEAKLGSALETPQAVSKFVADAQKRTFGRMILEYWVNGLISGPATHTTYMIGSTILALEKYGPETAAAAAIGNLRRAVGREGDTVRLGEVAAALRGGARGLAPALKASAEAFRTGLTGLLPGEGAGAQKSLPFQPGTEGVPAAMLDEAARFSDAMGAAFGVVRGVRDGIVSGAGLLKAGGAEGAPLFGARYSNLGAIPDLTLRGVAVAPLGTAARLPSRFIASIHSFFRAMNYSMEKSAIAYRTAANEGLTGAAFDARVGDIRQNPGDAVMEAARGGATELTLMGQGSEFTKALSRLTNTEIFGFPLLKFIDPFVHIAGNIIDQSIIQRTPVGILAPEIRADLMGKNGTVAQDAAQARMLVGTALSVAFGSLAAEGLLSGSGPSDPNKAAVWRMAGNQAHSVRIGDMWFDIHRLGPLGMLAGISADLYDVAHTAASGDMLPAASMLQHSFTQNILDESFMRGPADLIKAVEDPGRYGEAYIKNFASSFVPYSVGMSQIDRAVDPYSRQARTVMDSIRQKVPGLSEGLFPRRDIWGEPMPNRDALLAAGVTAIYESRMSRDPVNVALATLGVGVAPVPKTIRNVPLDDRQLDDFSRIAGRMTKQRLDAIVNSPDWATWPPHSRRDVIAEVVKQSRESARGVMMMKYPSIGAQATKSRMLKEQD